MPRPVDDDQLDDFDPEGPDPSEMDREDEPAVVPCPCCGKMISEETEICHLCGSYLSKEEIQNRVPKWIWIGTILAMLGFCFWLIMFFLRMIVS
jgi:hypothetical protein